MKVRLITNLPDGMVNIKETEIDEGLAIQIRPEGYSDHDSVDGHGCPVLLEVWEGHLRVIVWPDINKEEPMIIDLEKARESARK